MPTNGGKCIYCGRPRYFHPSHKQTVILCRECYECRMAKKSPGDDVYMPTPREIQEECRKIQSSWSPAIKRQRAGCGVECEVELAPVVSRDFNFADA